MSAPDVVILPAGYVSIYGLGGYTSPSGMLLYENEDFKFGDIAQVYSGGAVFVYEGDTIMFRERDVAFRYLVNDVPYTVVPCRLITKQTPPV